MIHFPLIEAVSSFIDLVTRVGVHNTSFYTNKRPFYGRQTYLIEEFDHGSD